MDDDIERMLQDFALGGPPDLTRAFSPVQASAPYFTRLLSGSGSCTADTRDPVNARFRCTLGM